MTYRTVIIHRLGYLHQALGLLPVATLLLFAWVLVPVVWQLGRLPAYGVDDKFIGWALRVGQITYIVSNLAIPLWILLTAALLVLDRQVLRRNALSTALSLFAVAALTGLQLWQIGLCEWFLD